MTDRTSVDVRMSLPASGLHLDDLYAGVNSSVSRTATTLGLTQSPRVILSEGGDQVALSIGSGPLRTSLRAGRCALGMAVSHGAPFDTGPTPADWNDVAASGPELAREYLRRWATFALGEWSADLVATIAGFDHDEVIRYVAAAGGHLRRPALLAESRGVSATIKQTRLVGEEYLDCTTGFVELVCNPGSTTDLGRLTCTQCDESLDRQVASLLGATNAALVPAIVFGTDRDIPLDWLFIRVGGIDVDAVRMPGEFWGSYRHEALTADICTALLRVISRCITLRAVRALLDHLFEQSDASHTVWFVRSCYADEEITAALRGLLRRGAPATSLLLLLRELVYSPTPHDPQDDRIAAAINRTLGFLPESVLTGAHY